MIARQSCLVPVADFPRVLSSFFSFFSSQSVFFCHLIANNFSFSPDGNCPLRGCGAALFMPPTPNRSFVHTLVARTRTRRLLWFPVFFFLLPFGYSFLTGVGSCSVSIDVERILLIRKNVALLYFTPLFFLPPDFLVPPLLTPSQGPQIDFSSTFCLSPAFPLSDYPTFPNLTLPYGFFCFFFFKIFFWNCFWHTRGSNFAVIHRAHHWNLLFALTHSRHFPHHRHDF